MSTALLELSEGQTIHLDSFHKNVHHCFITKFMDFEDGLSLVVSLSNTSYPLKVGDPMTARIASNGKLRSFPTRVLGIKSGEQNTLYLHYPLEIKPMKRRDTARMALRPRSLHLRMADGDKQIPVEVKDLSVAGACLVAPSRLGNVNDKFLIDMKVPYIDEMITLPCTFRYIHSELSVSETGSSAIHRHGVQFDPLEETAQRFIEDFIDNRFRANQPYSL